MRKLLSTTERNDIVRSSRLPVYLQSNQEKTLFSKPVRTIFKIHVMRHFSLLIFTWLLSVTSFAATVDPITGSTKICKGSTTTLSNAASGGVWTSSATTIASIGSSTGLLSGLNAGTAIITYA